MRYVLLIQGIIYQIVSFVYHLLLSNLILFTYLNYWFEQPTPRLSASQLYIAGILQSIVYNACIHKLNVIEHCLLYLSSEIRAIYLINRYERKISVQFGNVVGGTKYSREY
jgi:hypothetical protein